MTIDVGMLRRHAEGLRRQAAKLQRRAAIWDRLAGRIARRKAPRPKPTRPDTLNVEDAALYLGRTVKAVYALKDRRQLRPLPGSKGRLLFTVAELDRFLGAK